MTADKYFEQAITEAERAYSDEIFIEPTPEQVTTAVAAIRKAIGNCGSDCLHSSWARRILRNLRAKAKELERDDQEDQEPAGVG